MTDRAQQNVTDTERLAKRFEAARPRLLRIAQRILGSAAESDDALQETWLRIARTDVAQVTNFDGWLTTVAGRVCLDALKRRKTRREELTPDDPRRDRAAIAASEQPEVEALLADSIGAALLILLDTLSPAERVAFVLHDTFDLPFEEIAAIVGKSPEATRQLASRARRRVRGASPSDNAASQRHDELVRAFLQASRAGNFSALLALLDPAATLRADAAVIAMGGADYWQTDRLEVGYRGRADRCTDVLGACSWCAICIPGWRARRGVDRGARVARCVPLYVCERADHRDRPHRRTRNIVPDNPFEIAVKLTFGAQSTSPRARKSTRRD